MALAVNDIIQLSIRGTLFDQRIITVLHYAVNVSALGSDTDQLKQLTADWAAGTGSLPGILSHMLDCQGIQYTCNAIRAQRVYPTRTIYMETNSGDTGAHADDCTTANIAASLLKRTFTPGRMGIGRVQLAGIPQTAYAAGNVDNVFLATKLIPWSTDLKSTYTTSVSPVTYVPCLYNPTGPGTKISPIVNVIPEQTVRTMHRRTLRVGE